MAREMLLMHHKGLGFFFNFAQLLSPHFILEVNDDFFITDKNYKRSI